MGTEELFAILQDKLSRVRLDPDLSATVFFNITEPDPARWHGRLEGGRAVLLDGEPPAPDITVTASGATVLGLFQKTVSPMMAFMTGKIKLKGDPAKLAVLKGLLLPKKD
jgi:putative sterol carrier protein